MSKEASVSISPESTGPKVRTLQVDVIDDDGSIASTVQQVVTLADKDGDVVDFSSTLDIQIQILRELKKIRLGLELLMGESLDVDDDEDL